LAAVVTAGHVLPAGSAPEIKEPEVTELLYRETHEWVRVEEAGGQKIAVVGISELAAHELRDLVFIELPAEGASFKQGEEFGEIESVKSVSSLYSPITGEVTAVNTSLPDDLEQVSNDATGAGWMIKLKISDESELQSLYSAADYKKKWDEDAS